MAVAGPLRPSYGVRPAQDGMSWVFPASVRPQDRVLPGIWLQTTLFYAVLQTQDGRETQARQMPDRCLTGVRRLSPNRPAAPIPPLRP